MSKELEALNETVNKFADVILLGGHEERNATNLTNAFDYLERTPQIRTLRKCVKALEIIKENIIWVEDGKLKCGRYADIEIELEEEDFESKEEFNLLKEVLE